jgi:hypothetical protein
MEELITATTYHVMYEVITLGTLINTSGITHISTSFSNIQTWLSLLVDPGLSSLYS